VPGDRQCRAGCRLLGTSRPSPQGSVVERQAEGWWAVDDRQVINDVVFGEPVDGIFTGRARATDAQIIEKLRARGCDAVALAAPRSPGSSTLSHR
jgi:hypothetical protein